MSFEEILERATTDALLFVDDKEFNVAGVEKVKTASGDHVMWLWSTEGDWLVVDHTGDELIAFYPVEGEVEVDEDEFVNYAGVSYEEVEEDSGKLEELAGETEHEADDAYTFKHYEGEGSRLMRSLTWVGYGDEIWFCGKMLGEDDVRVS